MNTRWLAASLFLLLTAGVLALRAQPDEKLFPHDKHARLFPLCESCHEGVAVNNRAEFYPEPQLCVRCHDDTAQKRVSWTGPSTYASNLDFSHAEHAREEAREGTRSECSDCHTPAGAERMALRRRVEADRCFSCHAHRATNHFVDARCQQCHVPLAQTRFSLQRIEALPEPPSHESAGFLEEVHGRLAASEPERCVVCHTRESCATCHVDAQSRREVQAMPRAQPQLQLPRREARYFEPPSHQDPDWLQEHGEPAEADISECAACHTRESCLTCHTQRVPRPISRLVRRKDTSAPGVATSRVAPASHNAPFFEREHRSIAATSPATCTSCHAKTECESCHSATPADSTAVSAKGARPRDSRADFHPANFIERHASSSWGRNLDCQNCHETATFCRSCHENRGMRAVGRLQPGFHDAQPNWLLNHGRPARQGLESCASCHRQPDCTQCHSQAGAFRVNPHGPGFNAARLMARNPRACYICHLSDPLRR